MGRWFQRMRSRVLVLAYDLVMLALAWALAYWTRFNLAHVPAEFIAEAGRMLPLVLLVVGSVYWGFGLYRGVWRFASLTDLAKIVQAVLIGTTLLLAILFVFNRMAYVPRSLPMLFVVYQIMLLAGPRLMYRWVKDRRIDPGTGKRVLIVGAGSDGEMLVRDLLQDRDAGYLPIAFVDDHHHRLGRTVHGVPIRGTIDELPKVVDVFGIDLVLLAKPNATARQMQHMVDLCEATGKPFRTVPPTKDLVAGRVAAGQLRQVSIEDLLGRDPVSLDWDAIRRSLSDHVVLVSGAGGSIGAELCRQLCRCNPRLLVLIDHSEFNLYSIETELLESPDAPPIARHLLSVTDAVGVQQVFERYRPQVVFHAAAYKHVPLLEDQVEAAVRNNVIGTQVMAQAAAACACERFVLISTDKAVNPTNVMGATKRLAELICQAQDSRAGSRFMTVRFGNVLGSAGSVVPRFQRQIERGGPVTVTHPDIERFFMTIPEACQLIMQAAAIGDDADTFVLDMGEPVKIRYLAEQMILLSGRQPGRDIRIEYTGLRPGEKLYEDLFYPAEIFADTPHPRIHIARQTLPVDRKQLAFALQALHAALQVRDRDGLVAALKHAVPAWESGGGEDYCAATGRQRHTDGECLAG
uniref:NAD-dependent epimerase/dehydratase family protein n=2 Tax=Aromatoleum buckelii TaxID=200254 RepID=A0ABX1N7S1_9RHOO